MGRAPLFEKPMTALERQHRHRAKILDEITERRQTAAAVVMMRYWTGRADPPTAADLAAIRHVERILRGRAVFVGRKTPETAQNISNGKHHTIP